MWKIRSLTWPSLDSCILPFVFLLYWPLLSNGMFISSPVNFSSIATPQTSPSSPLASDPEMGYVVATFFWPDRAFTHCTALPPDFCKQIGTDCCSASRRWRFVLAQARNARALMFIHFFIHLYGRNLTSLLRVVKAPMLAYCGPTASIAVWSWHKWRCNRLVAALIRRIGGLGFLDGLIALLSSTLIIITD